MTAYGLMGTMLRFGVAEIGAEEIRFTNKFVAHLALFSEYIRSKESTVSSWREVFGAFDSALNYLNDKDVQNIVSLLDYYLHKIEVKTSALR